MQSTKQITNHACAKNVYALYFETPQQIRVSCLVCERFLFVVDANIELDFKTYNKHAMGHTIHSCLKEVQARYTKKNIIIDCLECGYPIKKVPISKVSS